METPVVSVITPVYNAEKYIKQAIESVLCQTYADWELLLVDDGSVDKSYELLQAYAERDRRIKLFKMKENQGPARARNLALEKAVGDYIAFLDCDDWWVPEKLERQLRFMQQMPCAFSMGSYEYVFPERDDYRKFIRVPPSMAYADLLKNTIICCSTVMVNRSVTGDFRMPDVRAGQDTATWLMLMRRGHLAHGMEEQLAYFRRISGSVSSNKVKAVKRTWHTYRNLEGLSFMKASYYMAHYMVRAFLRRI